ncbi:phytanoyl-CoA dioxygenase family protein [Nostoc sp. CENA67]|uniref:Phytanoyl-CoA dioxygenase family protein n=1 Tax=Amazonocrinis nigriterrae CENA67 TaxID=2794033 RepID=A0A8J7HZH7_9NOST|nr:phytanoyl-CoA dioxygenase family protein [Amazonocrinis nigriterrae]MBH8565179.1 phytanoyl-CoA dioxygenase family protein [Amazonocrinis nigriterrae CENA67]
MSTSLLNNCLENIFTKIYENLYENYKGLTQNPRWLLMRKVARFKIGRAIMLFFFKRSSQSYLTFINESNSCFAEIHLDRVVNKLKTEGLYLGINLPQEMVQEIIEFAKSTACYGNRKSNLGFYYHQKEQVEKNLRKHFTTGNYFNTGLLCPAIKKLQNDPLLLAIAARYLDTQPVHQGNHLWWSFAGKTTYHEQSQAAQFFHYDMDDYRFIKFFFYLTDVDETSGPHVCVRGSHNQKKLSHLCLRKRETDKDIIDYYGIDSLVKICGKAGFGFVEDPLCFHKGIPPTHQDRLILQIEFATTDYNMQHDIRETSLLKCIE